MKTMSRSCRFRKSNVNQQASVKQSLFIGKSVRRKLRYRSLNLKCPKVILRLFEICENVLQPVADDDLLCPDHTVVPRNLLKMAFFQNDTWRLAFYEDFGLGFFGYQEINSFRCSVQFQLFLED